MNLRLDGPKKRVPDPVLLNGTPRPVTVNARAHFWQGAGAVKSRVCDPVRANDRRRRRQAILRGNAFSYTLHAAASQLTCQLK